MSNRIRILFHCNLEGQQAHVGRKALFVMRRYVEVARMQALGASKEPPTYEWISGKEWVKRGKPLFKERQLDFSAPGDHHIYRVPMLQVTPSTPEGIPQFKHPVEEAQWLWLHLPPQVRQESLLTVTRESRRATWHKSRCNPATFGWTTRKAKTLVKKSPAPGAGSYWTVHYEPSTWTTNLTASQILSGALGQTPPAAPGLAPAEPLSSLDLKDLYAAKESAKAAKAKLWPAPTKSKKEPVKKVYYAPHPDYEAPEPPVVVPDNAPQTGASAPPTGKTPKKSLKLGVWA